MTALSSRSSQENNPIARFATRTNAVEAFIATGVAVWIGVGIQSLFVLANWLISGH